MTRFFLTQSFRKTGILFNEPGDPPPVPPVSPPPPPPAQVFTQEQVNKLLAENKRTLQAQNAEYAKQLEELKQSSNLSATEKEELAARIEQLSQQHMTEKEKTQHEIDKAKKKYETDTAALQEAGKHWQGQYQGLLIENAVIAGATTHKAANAEQMLDLLKQKAKVVPILDEATGQPTGKFTVKLPVKVLDPKTKAPTIVELDAVDAIGKMRDDPSNGNLFMFDGKTGLGGNNVPTPGTNTDSINVKDMTSEQFMAFRKKTYGK